MANIAVVSPEARMEKKLEWPMLVAALLVIPAIAIDESNLGHGWHATKLCHPGVAHFVHQRPPLCHCQLFWYWRP